MRGGGAFFIHAVLGLRGCKISSRNKFIPKSSIILLESKLWVFGLPQGHQMLVTQTLPIWLQQSYEWLSQLVKTMIKLHFIGSWYHQAHGWLSGNAFGWRAKGPVFNPWLGQEVILDYVLTQILVVLGFPPALSIRHHIYPAT